MPNFIEKREVIFMEKDVVVEEVKKEKNKFEGLLIKICFDFNINNYEEVVNNFLKSNKDIQKLM